MGRSRGDKTTLMQWKAFSAVIIDRMTQTKAAAAFGVTQGAISQRISRYSIARYGDSLRRGGRRVVVRPISLSFIENA